MPEPSESKIGMILVGARTFTIEVLDSGAKTWVVSRRNPKLRALLAVPPPTKNVPFAFNRFFVSPMEDTILTSRQTGTGTNEMRIFRRASGLHYVLAEKPSLNARIGKWKSSGKNRDGYDQPPDTVQFQRWEAGGRQAVLGCTYIGLKNNYCYFATLDVRTGRLFHFQHTKEDNIKEPS